MYKYETHCHTSMGSLCAHISVEDAVKVYKQHGYDGVFITEHFFNGNTAVKRGREWKDMVADYFKPYEKAAEIGRELGIDVFCGWEYTYWYKGNGGKMCGGTDFLTYGLDKDWLAKHPEIMELELSEYFDFIHDNGGFIIHAHPFREADYIDMLRLLPYSVDGIEVLNSSRPEKENRIAEIFADYYGIPKTSGSDFHGTDREWISGVMTEEKLVSPLDLLRQMKENKIKIFKEEL